MTMNLVGSVDEWWGHTAVIVASFGGSNVSCTTGTFCVPTSDLLQEVIPEVATNTKAATKVNRTNLFFAIVLIFYCFFVLFFYLL